MRTGEGPCRQSTGNPFRLDGPLCPTGLNLKLPFQDIPNGYQIWFAEHPLRTAVCFGTSAANCGIRQPECPIFVAARLYPNHTVADAVVQQPSSICGSVGRLLIPVSDGRRPDPATRSEPPKRAASLSTRGALSRVRRAGYRVSFAFRNHR